ncbi:alanine--tRNA ligase [Lactobacillus terrae]|uniref:alanine--tRNA ligase n=1 Tax=Lactobacillus terrae TaxID=2269374 RepID=UPI000C1B7665|nr:alanine--tRNA ligase [Lactobacillus terrae]
MKELSSAEIRQMFLDFFKSKKHSVEPSVSLIPKDDPTLLWINSGVATLKKYFDGSVIPENPRITNAQKCIRTNDIENVGHTARHQTFFEMLGNFSVGDYFKEDAIPWAYEFLTSPEWIDMNEEKIYVTVYPKDKLAKEIWLKTGVAEDHIIEEEDNFWDIGEGPCGPDSEIFYDRGQEFNNISEDDPENRPGGENERYLEVWNIVFSELNHLPDGSYVEQPHKNIDTGMGLERLVSIIQGTKTNFETDLFMPLIENVSKISDNRSYGKTPEDDVSFKIIADHARTVSFAVSDGALPSNEGRGYVIRRLIRRAVLNGKKLGIDGAFLYKLVPIVGDIMKSYYPNVSEQSEFVAETIKNEEDRFSETLDAGLTLLNDVIAQLKSSNDSTIDGATAFKLYDTYGFPLEMTVEYANDEGLKVDQDGFQDHMEQQKQRARSARGNMQSMGMQDETLMDIETKSEFVGYTENETNSVLKDIVVSDSLVDSVSEGQAQLIFDKTPFYAEMGGQVADKGFIYDSKDNKVSEVIDVQHAPNGQNIHLVNVLADLSKDQNYLLKIDVDFREGVRHNHTATHLLDQALRDVVNENTHQAGSLVEEGYLRFDFNSNKGLSSEELSNLEKIVNEKIWQAIPVVTEELPIEEAQKKGAIAMFGDKYGDIVRVVEVDDYSMEFCGGTHVSNTSEIGLFKIISESAVGSGVRRIEAVTGKEAFEYLNNNLSLLQETADNMKVNQVKDLPKQASQIVNDVKTLKRENQKLKDQITSQKSGQVFENVDIINDLRVVATIVPGSDMGSLRKLADTWKNNNSSDVLVLGTGADDKASLVVAVNDEAQSKGIKAGDLIKQISGEIKGGGGGRSDMAQAGGKDPAGLQKAIQMSKEIIKSN